MSSTIDKLLAMEGNSSSSGAEVPGGGQDVSTVDTTNVAGSPTDYDSPARNESLAKIEITVLSIILVITIVGNSLMLIALRRQLQFRPMSRMYFFMLNLSIADLFVAFGNILPQLAWDITFRFQGNDLLCRIVKFLQVFVLYLSTYILTSMAIDRYLVVCHHSFSRNYYSGIKGPRILVAISYIISFLLATPQAFIFSYMEVPGSPGITDCWVTFTEPWGEKAYVTFFVGCAFIFPLMVIGVSYGAISCKVVRFSLPKEARGGAGRVQKPSGYKERRKNKYSFSSSTEHTKEEHETGESSIDETPLRKQQAEERGALRRQISQAKMKTLKLTLTVVICFFVCWAPFCITHLVIAYNPQNVGPLQVIFLLLASLNSCANPWIYLAFSESLCNQLRVSLGFGLRRASDEESIGDEKEMANPQRQRNDRGAERGRTGAGGKKIPIAVLSDHHNRNGEQVQPETKSDIV